MRGLVDDLQCSCARLTLEAEGRGQLTVFTCPVCVELARQYHGVGQLSFFPQGERESSVSALVAPEAGEKKICPEGDSSVPLPF